MEWTNAEGLVIDTEPSILSKKLYHLKLYLEYKYGPGYEFLYETFIINKPRLDYLFVSARKNPEYKLTKINAASLNYVAKKSEFTFNDLPNIESPFDSY